MNSIENQSIDSSSENIDYAVLREAGDTIEISAEWSATTSALNSLDTTSSNTYTNINTLKECCAESSDTMNRKNDFVVIDTTYKRFDADESKNLTICKTCAFKKKHKFSFNNMSSVFENILNDDCQIEETIYLNHFQKRKRLSPPNDENFVNINDNNGRDIVDISLGSSKTKFKHPSKFSLMNASTNNLDKSKVEELPYKFTQRTEDLVNSAFDNVINGSSMTSSSEFDNNSTTLKETSVSNLNRNSQCDTEEIPSLNQAHDVHANSTQKELLSQSIKICNELINIEKPINETYRLENNLSCNVSLESLNTKKTLSDTNENNFKSLNFSNKTINTLTDMSNIYNQSKSIRKLNFICKLQLNEGSQEYNITIGDDNSTVNDEMNQKENNNSKRFMLNSIYQDANSIIFDDIITSCQRNKTSTTDSMSKTLNNLVETSKNNDLLFISPGPTFKENLEESFNKSTTKQSNMCNKFFENDKNISEPNLLKSNKSNSFSQQSNKFNFSKQFGRFSVSYQEKSDHDLSVPRNKAFMLSQAQDSYFMKEKNLSAHSEMFNDLIDNNSNSTITLNDSKEIKFKSLKNMSEGDSIIFENVITSIQETNSTFTQNKTINHSVIFDKSKIQANNESSLYANANSQSFNEKSSRKSNYSFKNHALSKILNLEKSKCLDNELLKDSKISTSLSKQKNSHFANNTVNKSTVSSIIDESNKLYLRKNNVNNVSIHSFKNSKDVANSINVCINSSEVNHSKYSLSSKSFIDTVKTPNDSSILEIDPNNDTISTSLSKQSNTFFSNDQSTDSNIIDISSKINKLSNSKLKRFSSVSVKKDKPLPNKMVLENESLILKNNVNTTSTHTFGISRSVAYSKNEVTANYETYDSDSELWTTLTNKSNIYNQSKSSVWKPNFIRKLQLNQGSQEYNITIGSDSSTVNDKMNQEEINKSKRFKLNNIHLDANSIIFDDVFTSCQRNVTSTTDSMSKTWNASVDTSKNNHSLNISHEHTLKEDLEVSVNKSMTLQSNMHQNNFFENDKNIISNPHLLKFNKSNSFFQRSSKFNFSKQFDHLSVSSHEKSCHDLSVPQNTRFTLSQTSGPHFARKKSLNAHSEVFNGIIENNLNSNMTLNDSKEIKFKSHKKISKGNSIIFENVINMSSRSSRSSKSVAFSKNESNANDKTYDSDSVLWTTLSVSSIENTSLNVFIPKDNINIVSEISTHLAQQKNSSVANNLPVLSSIINEFPENNKSSSTRVTRSSAKYIKNDKSLGLGNNKNNISTRSSLRNEFNTPTNNKLAMKERIINTIGVLSANKQKATNPGVFELEKIMNSPLRSFAHSPNHSPSILSRVFVANNSSKSASSIIGNISIDQLKVENNVEKNFISLYNKESWITKRLYNFLIGKLQLKYGIYSVKYAEKFVKYLASILKRVYRGKVNFQLYTDMLRYHMARYGIIEDTSDYLGFLTNYIPRPYYDRLIPGWNLEVSDVKFDPQKYYIPIMEDEEFLRNVLENLIIA